MQANNKLPVLSIVTVCFNAKQKIEKTIENVDQLKTRYKDIFEIQYIVVDDTHIRGHLLVLPNGGSIKIGNLCYVGENTKIWSMSSILIGNNVLISHGVNIHDNISHPISAESRRRQAFEIFKGGGHPSELPDVPAKPIVIEDDVWVGFNATILKGVRIGRGAIIGACSVVTGNVNPYSIVVGNPARVIGQATP